MPTFEVTIPRRLLCKWPEGKEVELLGCCFKGGNSELDLIVQIEVEAKNEEDAIQLGLEKTEDAINLFQFCADLDVYSNSTQVTVREKGSSVSTGVVTLSMGAFIASYEPLPTQYLSNINKAQITIDSENDLIRKESLMRVAHWYARGRREKESKIDRFLMFWIALEILVDGRGKMVTRKVKDRLSSIYPNYNIDKIAEVVGRVYGIRGDIVHQGVRQPENLDEKLEQLEDIFADLLRARLGLPPKYLSESFFV